MENNPYIDFSEKHKKTIRVLFAHNPPEVFDECRKFPTLHPTISCPFPGWCAEIINYLSEYAHLRIEPVIHRNVPGHMDWGNFTNGSWDGIFGLIQNGTVDTVCAFFQQTKLRAEHFTFSYPLTSTQLYYLVHSRVMDFSSRMWNTFSPYGNSTWLAMGIMLILQTLYCIWLANMETKIGLRKDGHYTKFQIIWKLVRFQLYQPDRFDFATAAGNFSLLVFTIMQCRLLMDMYQTLLLSSLLQPVPPSPFTDGGELIRLVAHRKYQFVTNYKGNWYFEELLHANTSHEKSLRAAIGNNIVETSTIWEAIDYVEKGGYIFPIQENSMTAIYVRRRCNLALVGEGLPRMLSHFMFSKNSSVARAMNKAIVMNRDFIRRTYRKYMKYGYKLDYSPTEDCNGPNSNTKFYSHSLTMFAKKTGLVADERIELKPLNIASMFGIFFMFVLGICLSLFAFFTETSYYHKQQSLLRRFKFHREMLEPAILSLLINKQLDIEQLDSMRERMERIELPEVRRGTANQTQENFGEVGI